MKNNTLTKTEKARADYKKYVDKFPRRDFNASDIMAIWDEARYKNPYDVIANAMEVGFMFGYRAGLKDGKQKAKGV